MINFNTKIKIKKQIRDLETLCDKIRNTDTSQYSECSLGALRCR